ncbi:phosphotransferase enzyme family protein [Vallitalea maricola]|uniref:Phosphotransferase enzyme family protein n=1 Tax=Vallitalea maricola TaxID=3074433 RepID=A0ACB5UPK7_9FIRM|nr:phosphotransferase enzyme family protein [Vallitalea sp. AN17-2]
MMRLKYLYDNRELVMNILDYWEYDEKDIDILDQYRISSNAVYPFSNHGKIQLLRFSPVQEKLPEDIKAELEYIKFLKEEKYPVLELVASNNNKEMELIDTSWGKYSAVVFKRVKGVRLDKVKLNGEIIYNLGCSLGRLHKLSNKFVPKNHNRISYIKQLEWMDNVLSDYENENFAKKEVEILKKELGGLDKNNTNFGLIHYDFDLDNVFWDEQTNTFNVIDFDDAVYHWYVMDIILTIQKISESLPDNNKLDVEKLLIKGYKTQYMIDDDIYKKTEIFKRYGFLYSYIRCLRSLSEPIDNKPEWMINLINTVKEHMESSSRYFGKEIVS